MSRALSERLCQLRIWLEIHYHSHPLIKSFQKSSLAPLLARSLFEGQAKSFRPYLMLSTVSELRQNEWGCPSETLLNGALVLECVHTYSLLHDDLPCMDNDDWRRGVPSLHRIHGDSRAVLAGDALLTLAFELLASTSLPDKILIRAIREVSAAVGVGGMIGGQILDLESSQTSTAYEELEQLQVQKTGALISASLILGALFSQDERYLQNDYLDRLKKWGFKIGLIFQARDDELDADSQDIRLQRLNFISLYGAEGTRKWILDQTTLLFEEGKILGLPCLAEQLKNYLSERNS